MTIGENIRDLRKSAGLTQTALANMLFISQDTVSLWELDKALPDINALILMTKIFKVTSDYILGLED